MRRLNEEAGEVRKLDNPDVVSGGVVGTDPFRRWGPTARWISVVILAPILGANWRPFNKRDVVVTDPSGTDELYREGPFTSSGAQHRQQAIVLEIDADGLATFLRRRQIEESTIGPVSASRSQPSRVQETTVSMRIWWDRLRGADNCHQSGDQGCS